MIQAEEQIQCVICWYKNWTSECRGQLLDFLVLQAVPDSVESLLQGVSQLGVESSGPSTFQCQLRLLAAWFEVWSDVDRNRLLQLLDIADTQFMPSFRARTAPR